MHRFTKAYVSVASRFATLRAQSERGLTTTEVAVLTFILVGIAIVIGGLLLGAGTDAITNIDSSPTVSGGGNTTSTGTGGPVGG